ncbi:hypothetical protein RchiOBHm_Chr6g0273551 [Rosa chinensis]|uniref:Transmembrane protein n=1 Tax=Rosa chinensis TaxID=74649 RepID=A0A2P6PRI0_ROSCH|nr:hypothetical protein RchiOBHm_Chr6g0273551 [Rosa chinensis]
MTHCTQEMLQTRTAAVVSGNAIVLSFKSRVSPLFISFSFFALVVLFFSFFFF